ncbi:MAG TPA: DUF434 domain-containing protein [Abditibacterium sp.]|jgi:hypothetical protein
MPDSRTHRGPHPSDAQIFAPAQLPVLQRATLDYSWLLSRGYAPKSSLELVGNRYQLPERGRLGVMRAACPDAAREARRAKRLEADAVRGQILHLDGYNVLMIVEAALGGGVLLRCRDEGLRDMASMHGNFRRVEETAPAITMIGNFLASLSLEAVVWWLDAPVSNSGRLAGLIRELAEQNAWNWRVEMVPDADFAMKKLENAIVATADSVILDVASAWFNLGAAIVARDIPSVWLVDLSA